MANYILMGIIGLEVIVGCVCMGGLVWLAVHQDDWMDQ